MRLPYKEGLRSSKLIRIVAGGSALAVSSVAVAQAFDGGESPQVDTVDLRGDSRVGDDREVLLNLEGNTVAVPTETLLADNVDDTNGSPDDSPDASPVGIAASNDSLDDSPAAAPAGSTDDSPDDSDSSDDSPPSTSAPGANDSPEDSGDDSADDS